MISFNSYLLILLYRSQYETDDCFEPDFDSDYAYLVTESVELLDVPEQNAMYRISGYISENRSTTVNV